MTLLTAFELFDRRVTLRRAQPGDVVGIVALLVDDTLGATRDGASGGAGLEPYFAAFGAIDADPGQLLVVAHVDDADARDDTRAEGVGGSGRVVGTMQLTFIPGLARRGALRAQVEAVRVHSDLRGSGLGTAMFEWVIAEAKERGCGLVQLTTDKQRTRAHAFYEALGFVASHEGFKLTL